MHVSKDSMWRGIWKILQNFWGTKQGLNYALTSILSLENISANSQPSLLQFFRLDHLCTFGFTLWRYTASVQQKVNKGNSSNCTEKLVYFVNFVGYFHYCREDPMYQSFQSKWQLVPCWLAWLWVNYWPADF
jgi:hypothetical protein